MRLFAGISLSYSVRRNLELVLAHLQPLANVHWSPVENLHLTTKFIGEWPEDRLDALRQALREMPKRGAFSVEVRSFGWFPNPHHPRVFFAGIAAPPALGELHAATSTALAAVGVAREEKPYSPHLTLARIRTNIDLLPLKRAIAELPSVDFGRIDVTKFQLYLSRPGPRTSIYTVLEEYSL